MADSPQLGLSMHTPGRCVCGNLNNWKRVVVRYWLGQMPDWGWRCMNCGRDHA